MFSIHSLNLITFLNHSVFNGNKLTFGMKIQQQKNDFFRPSVSKDLLKINKKYLTEKTKL